MALMKKVIGKLLQLMYSTIRVMLIRKISI